MKKIFTLSAIVILMSLTGCNSSDDNNVDGGGNISGGGEPPPPTPGACDGAAYQDAINAILQRDHSLASEEQLLDYSQCVLDSSHLLRNEVVKSIYNGVSSPYTWKPGGYSHVFLGTNPEQSFSVLNANWYNGDKEGSLGSLVLAGINDKHRYVSFSQDILNNKDDPEQSLLIFNNAVNWLTDNSFNRTPSSYQRGNDRHIVLSGVSQELYDHIQAVFANDQSQEFTLNAFGSCDKTALLSCLSAESDVDILVISNDDVQVTYEDVKAGVEFAIENKIPILTSASQVKSELNDDVLNGIYKHLGVSVSYNIGGGTQAIDVMPEDVLNQPYPWLTVAALLNNLKAGKFNVDMLNPDPDKDESSCEKNLLDCNLMSFKLQFKNAADWYRTALSQLDRQGIDVLGQPEQNKILSAGVLLADKYRNGIDYPIDAKMESANFQRALFGDWVTNYSRFDNQAQPDLGTFVLDYKEVLKNNNATYRHESISNDTRTFSVPYQYNWTTTGWYVQPGQTVTLSSDNEQNAVIEVQLNYARSGSLQIGTEQVLSTPQDVSMLSNRRLVLLPGQKISFSSPYGGPIYIYFTDKEKTSVMLSATGIVKHAAILSDTAEEKANFSTAIDNTEIPHVDIRIDGAEFHMRKDKFMAGLVPGSDITNIDELIDGITDHVNIDYTLAGYKIMGKELSESLPQEVLSLCSDFFGGRDCIDPQIHTRDLIQHANFDQTATCGAGCSGNPRDASWAIAPYGWGDNHELGHNLQTQYLNTFYVSEDKKNDWTSYKNRSGESSNNIFPYHILWQHHFVDKKRTNILFDDHSNTLDVFNVIMSDMLNKDHIYDSQCNAMPDEGAIDRYTSPWASDSYDPHAFRMAFYTQMAMQADNSKMKNNSTLQNGFDIYTLLYQHSRIFTKYANEDDWDNHKTELGFDKFSFKGENTYSGGTVVAMPGNDFMLISLSFMTHKDWRPFFNMFGLRYTDLANAQVESFTLPESIEQKLFVRKAIAASDNDIPPNLQPENFPDNAIVLPNEKISNDENFIWLDMTEKTTTFPGHEIQSCLQ